MSECSGGVLCRSVGARASLNRHEVVRLIDTLDGKYLILGENLHSWRLMAYDASFASIYATADLILADGFPVAAYRTISRRGAYQRTGSTDWILALGSCRRPLRVAVIGSRPGVAGRAALLLKESQPQHEFATWDGYLDAEILQAEKLFALRQFEPDLLLVGMGMPRQETWVAENWSALPDCVIACVGGAIDQIAGVQRNAPRWLGPLGLEWAWRLATQPRRLWRRYLIEPWSLLWRFGRLRRIMRDQEQAWHQLHTR